MRLPDLDLWIDSTTQYLLAAQEMDGPYRGAIWSEKAYHNPLLDHHAGGSHHYRTPGPAAACFARQASGERGALLNERACLALDWVCGRQHPDGALDEITNNEAPSRWHGDVREASTISLALAVHGLAEAIRAGLPCKPEWRRFLTQAARWQLTAESPVGSGNFLHSGGYPPEKVILNACAHAAETLLSASDLGEGSGEEQADWLQAAIRALEQVLRCQADDGAYPYSDLPGDTTISYTAAVCWCLQNVQGHRALAPIAGQLDASCARAIDFLGTMVDDAGCLRWEPYETHGQKFRTYPMVMTARVLARAGRQDTARRILGYLEDLYDPQRGLLRVLDIPLGQTVTIFGHRLFGEKIFEVAFNQADMLESLLDLREDLLV